MIAAALGFAFVCFSLALLCNLWRVMFSRGVPDRVLALDTMSIDAIAMLALFGIYEGTGVYFEASMLFAMMGFVSTVAYARFLLRGEIIE